MRNNPDMQKSLTDHWATPKKWYEHLTKDMGFIDPCPLHSDHNALATKYEATKLFVNPPFSQLEKWVNWIIEQVENECQVLLLMPARTDTKYFHKLLKYRPIIFFIKGRLHFNDSKNGAPFPTILVDIKKSRDKYSITHYSTLDSIKLNQ